MEDEIHLNPTIPPKTYGKSDVELATFKPQTQPNHHKSSSKCLVYTMLVIVLLSVIFLIFGLVVFRINTPSLRLSSVAISNLRHNSTSLNMTMVAEIRVRNKNFGPFDFRGGSTTLMYENATIGTENINEGRVGRRESGRINVTIRVNHSANFSREISTGLVSLRNLAELRGEVRVMKIVNRHRIAVMNCSMVLNLTSQAVQGLSCE